MSNIDELIDFENRAYKALKKNWGQVLDSSPLTTFTYLQFFDNGTFTNLCSDQEWSKKYYTMDQIDLHFFRQIEQALVTNEYHVYLWPSNPSAGKITSWLVERGMGNGFTVFKREGNKVHGWGFTSAEESSELMNYYLSNRQSFLQFGGQFAAEYHRYSTRQSNIPHAEMGLNFSSGSDRSSINQQAKFIVPKMNKVKIFMDDASYDISLGQWEVMELLAKGNTGKQIAHTLNISSKTVEQRLNNMRDQLGIFSRDKFFKIWRSNSGG